MINKDFEYELRQILTTINMTLTDVYDEVETDTEKVRRRIEVESTNCPGMKYYVAYDFKEEKEFEAIEFIIRQIERSHIWGLEAFYKSKNQKC